MPGKRVSSGSGGGRLMASLGGADDNGNKQLQLPGVVNDTELVEVLQTVFEDGGAVMIARTSDGGALCFTFYVDGERVKKYVTSREQWLALHAALVQ